ncbi:quinone oxidoreductase family protein [Chryseosolibacter indicus]|uniref:Zinc-binding dehydrogenase n=1 Tax=Chryseosolibacter indicus TaxID=2782351 RepID=A0ABS5VSC6_9BACT|nr:zinc-binding dehydrogenase [Chryseosolibacter indicus]MBT1704335.1 zinc-binding dehydrogenase [Chryseosolibacter indicus]
MKAIKVASFGSAEELVIAEMPQLEAGNGQVVIDVEVAGVGFVDVLARKGFLAFPNPGFIPGVEVAGTVIKIGENVEPVWLNQRVFALTHVGGYAEEVVANVTSLSVIPAGLTFSDAVALGVNSMVAEFSLQRAGSVSGKEVLVRGAGGGIGSLSAQLAIQKGARVSAISSSADKQKQLKNLAITNLFTDVNELSENFDVVIDPVAGPDAELFIKKLKPNGKYILNGAVAGLPSDSFASNLFINFQNSLTISCVSLSSIPHNELAKTMEYLFNLATTGKIKPIVAKTFLLPDAAEAHRYVESGKAFGKILLKC